ncbi:MAG: 2-oxoacid:acceptor oxidoreductase family protein [Candidatus Saccharibacteria bacterium]
MATHDLVEIRWHGRGGQGAKSACLLLADAAGMQGKFVQGFPEYGPERMGAPITAYNRISEKRCSIHSNIYYPDYVVVVDETLLDSIDVTAGLKEAGAIIINTPSSPQEMRPRLNGFAGKVCTIDGRRISEEFLGKNLPNTPMLAAVVKVSGVLETERFLADIEESFKHKFASKPQVIDGNMATLKKSLEEVQVG